MDLTLKKLDKELTELADKFYDEVRAKDEKIKEYGAEITSNKLEMKKLREQISNLQNQIYTIKDCLNNIIKEQIFKCDKCGEKEFKTLAKDWKKVYITGDSIDIRNAFVAKPYRYEREKIVCEHCGKLESWVLYKKFIEEEKFADKKEK